MTDGPAGITLLLYSRLSGLTTGFRFAESDGNVTVPQSVSDPYRIEYPAELWHRDHKKNARDRNISSLLLVSTKYSTLVNTNPKRSNSIPRGNQLELYGLFVLANDLSLHRCVYERGLTAAEWRRWKAEKVEVVNRTDPGTSSSNRRVRHEQAEDDAFVVGDDYLSPCEAPRETSRDGRGDLSKATACVDRDIWTLQWEWLYKHAFLEMDYMPHGQRNERQNAKVPAESQKEQRVIKAARRCFLENRAADGPSLTLYALPSQYHRQSLMHFQVPAMPRFADGHEHRSGFLFRYRPHRNARRVFAVGGGRLEARFETCCVATVAGRFHPCWHFQCGERSLLDRTHPQPPL